MAYRPTKAYIHDGVKFRSKHTYALPPEMGAVLVKLGLFRFVDASPDLDMSHLTWDQRTSLAEELLPDGIVQSQGVAQ